MARRPGFFLPCCLLAYAAHAAEGELLFGWTADMTCSVEQRILVTGAPETLLRFDLRTSVAGDGGMFVEAVLPELQAPAAGDEMQMSPGDARFLLASKLPPFHVGEAGSLMGLRDAARARERLRDVLVASLPAPLAPADMDQLVGKLGNPDTLENQVSNFWNAAVEQWVGKQLSAKPIEGTAETQIPGSDAPLKVTVTMESAGERDCTRGGKARRCIEVISTEVPEAENLRKVMRAILGPEGEAEIDRIHSMSMHTRTVTLTEPETLIPHLVTVTRTINITRKGDTAPAETLERQSWKFDCH